jgi:hypothetical protein
MGTIGHGLLLAILVVIGLFSLSSAFFMDEAFGRAFKGEVPRESNANLFMRRLGYLAFGIVLDIVPLRLANLSSCICAALFRRARFHYS